MEMHILFSTLEELFSIVVYQCSFEGAVSWLSLPTELNGSCLVEWGERAVDKDWAGNLLFVVNLFFLHYYLSPKIKWHLLNCYLLFCYSINILKIKLKGLFIKYKNIQTLSFSHAFLQFSYRQIKLFTLRGLQQEELHAKLG